VPIATGLVTGWNRPTSWGGDDAHLADHVDRHGADFGIDKTDAATYAHLAEDFLKEADYGKFWVLIDNKGVIRMWDPTTKTFAAYNKDGTTRTLFKPDQNKYPGDSYWWKKVNGKPPPKGWHPPTPPMGPPSPMDPNLLPQI
jgi:pyocin large subunit-like protein